MNRNDDVALCDSKCGGGLRIENLDHFLEFQIMVAGPQRASFGALALFGLLRDLLGQCTSHAAALLDALEILGCSIAAFDGPARTAFEHGIHFRSVQMNMAPAAETRRNRLIEAVRQLLFHRFDVIARKTGVERPDTARNVETDTARRNHAALVGIERGNAADGKTIPPMGVGHDIAGAGDAGQCGDIDGLFAYLVVHGLDQFTVGIDDHRRLHRAERLHAPRRIGGASKTISIHRQ